MKSAFFNIFIMTTFFSYEAKSEPTLRFYIVELTTLTLLYREIEGLNFFMLNQWEKENPGASDKFDLRARQTVTKMLHHLK